MRVIYGGDNLDQLKKLPDACVDLIYIAPHSTPTASTVSGLAGTVSGVRPKRSAFEYRHKNTNPPITGRQRFRADGAENRLLISWWFEIRQFEPRHLVSNMT
jgi:hypothetical protein